MKPSVLNRIQKVKLFIMDVDGVLTDGKIYLGNEGEELKGFDVKDGKGIMLVQDTGVKFAIITGRKSKIVDNRAKELNIDQVYQGISDKLKIYKELLKNNKLEKENTAYIGDDIPDLPVLKEVGFSVSVSDGVPVIRQEVDYVTEAEGGKGAVREVMDLILKVKGEFIT